MKRIDQRAICECNIRRSLNGIKLEKIFKPQKKLSRRNHKKYFIISIHTMFASNNFIITSKSSHSSTSCRSFTSSDYRNLLKFKLSLLQKFDFLRDSLSYCCCFSFYSLVQTRIGLMGEKKSFWFCISLSFAAQKLLHERWLRLCWISNQ